MLLSALVAFCASAYLLAVASGLETRVRVCYALVTCKPALTAMLGILLAVALATSPVATAVAAPLIAVGVWLLAPHRTRRAVPPGSAHLRLVAANVLFSNDRPAEIAAALAELDPDVVVVCEVFSLRDELAAGLAPLVPVAAGGTSSRAAAAPHDFPGDDVVVFARPGTAVADTPLTVPGRDLPSVLVTTSAGPLRVVGVHTCAPGAGTPPRRWRSQLHALAAALAAASCPTVLAGDFNASLWLAPFLRRFAHAERWYSPTWPAALPLLELDHAVASGCTVASIRRVKLPGSDHLGLVAELYVPPAAPSCA